MLHRQSQAFIQRSRHHWIAPPYPQNPEPNLPAWKASSNDFPASWSSGSSLRSRFIEPSTPWLDKTAIALPVNPNRCQHEETQSKRSVKWEFRARRKILFPDQNRRRRRLAAIAAEWTAIAATATAANPTATAALLAGQSWSYFPTPFRCPSDFRLFALLGHAPRGKWTVVLPLY